MIEPGSSWKEVAETSAVIRWRSPTANFEMGFEPGNFGIFVGMPVFG
jgi:hypothetical protein